MLGSCNTANYNSSADWNGLNGNLTTVGSNGRSSYYGTYDQTGNINELLDTNNGNWKIFRGGSFLSSSGQLSKDYVDTNILDLKRTDIGFRIAQTANVPDSSNYVLINNINNISDTNNLGSVSYSYQIKKYTVTNNEYTEFLNSISKKSNGLDLWVSQMGDISQRGGIDRSGSSPNYVYSVKFNMGDKPVNFINWFSAARFINWLHNNKPVGDPGSLTTEDGVYTLTNFVVNGSTKPSRNNTNSFWLPNENEWYKSAYYDATKNGGGGYWNYATLSDDTPDSIVASSDGEANGTSNPNNCITPTPTPTTTTSVTPTPSTSLTATPSTTPTTSISATRTPTISVSVSPTTTPSITPTRTPTRTIQVTPTTTPTTSTTKTPTPSVTVTNTSSPTPSITATITPTPSKTMIVPIPVGQLIYQNNIYFNDNIQMLYKGFHFAGKLEPNISVIYEAPNVSPTRTPTNTPTVTPTISVSVTPSVTPSQSLSVTPTYTPTVSVSLSSSNTPTPTVTPTISVSFTPSVTPSQSLSTTPTITPTNTPSITATITPTSSVTASLTPTSTITITPTITNTPSVTTSATNTPTPTVTPTKLPDTSILALGYNSNQSAKSIDGGLTWSMNNMPSNLLWTSITKDDTKYIACAYAHNNIYVSNDGLSWTQYSISNLQSSNHLWINLIYGNNTFVITPINSAVAARSSNGTSWTETYLPAFANWKGGAYGNNMFLVAAENSSTAATSSDGNTWTMRSLPLSRRWLGVEYLNNNFIIIADNNNTIVYSSDGINWNSSTLPSTNDWYSITYGNSTYIILALDGSIIRSNDLINWQSSNIISGSWKTILYKDKFVAIGTNIAYTSPNGLTWTQRTIGNYQWFDAV